MKKTYEWVDICDECGYQITYIIPYGMRANDWLAEQEENNNIKPCPACGIYNWYHNNSILHLG